MELRIALLNWTSSAPTDSIVQTGIPFVANKFETYRSRKTRRTEQMPNGIYLTTNDNPTQIVRCPVHGFIRFSRNERHILDHDVFQRLRRIRQLALTFLVYPGAVHTRFEHSLGVI